MKNKLLLLLLLSCLMATVRGQAQSSMADRITGKDTGLVIYPQKDPDKFVVAAALDKRTHIYYLITCFGQVADSAHMASGDYALLLQKKTTPFEHYNAICDKVIAMANTAKDQLRQQGNMSPGWPHASLMAAYIPELKRNISSLQKIILLDELCQYYLTQKWIVNNPNPKYLTEDSSTLYNSYDDGVAGSMLVQTGTTIYYNKNNIANPYKAVLLTKAATIVYYDRNNMATDSLALNPKEVSLVLAQKTDVFLLYRGWLEMQKQSLEEKISLLDSLQRKHANRALQFANNNTSNPAAMAAAASRAYGSVISHLETASLPDPKAIATILHRQYKAAPVHHTLLASLGMGIINTSTRGSKWYELTDHRGNVLVTVSDKKIGHTSNQATIDYYQADVISATDYSSFGALLPGRTYQSDKYRYGHNGKEKDNEVKGEGNQVDYGFRIYDPRLGKFLSVDPLTKKYPELTPYQFASNSPVDGIDEDGLEWAPSKDKQGNTTDYTWAGYNNDGTPKSGTVSGGIITRGNYSFWYLSDAKAKLGYVDIFSNKKETIKYPQGYDKAPLYNYHITIQQSQLSEMIASATAYATNGHSGSNNVNITPTFWEKPKGDLFFSKAIAGLGLNLARTSIDADYPETIFLPLPAWEKAVGYAGSGYFKLAYRFAGQDALKIDSRLITIGHRGLGHGQFDVLHRGTTFFVDDIIKNGKLKVVGATKINFQISTSVERFSKSANKYIKETTNFSITANPWTRRIWHMGPNQ